MQNNTIDSVTLFRYHLYTVESCASATKSEKLERQNVAGSASDATWDEIKRLYIETGDSVEKIAVKFGVCRSAVFKKAAQGGWPSRRAKRAKSSSTGVAVSGGGAAKGAQVSLEKRLYQVMIRKLEKLEQRMIASESLSPADNEREMREIGAMIRGFEKVKEGGNGEKGAGSARRSSNSAACASAERMREEITERLERLHERSRSQQNPE